MTITATSDNQIRKSNIRNWTIGLQTFATGSLPRSGLVQRALRKFRRGRAGHSGLMRADLITLPHFSVSSAMNLPKSAGEPGSTVLPTSASRALILASSRPALISLFSLLTISAEVFLGAPTPKKPLASKPGTNSPTVGTSGSIFRARPIGHGERTYLTGPDVSDGSRQRRCEYDLHLSAKQISQSGCRTTIWHMMDVDAGHHLEQLAGYMAWCPVAARCEVDLAGIGL